jgi:hypothetical protein
MASPWMLAKRMSPAAPQLPVTPKPRGMSQIATAPEEPETSIRFNLSSAANAIERLSGDQKSDRAPSVPGTGFGSSEAKDRTKIRRSPVLSRPM